MYINVCRMHVRQNGETLEEVDYSQYLVWQLVADGGCARCGTQINEVCKAWSELKSVLSS